jgi:8-oxo-dGTP pyrophosphatase MutT (NUDIX family)
MSYENKFRVSVHAVIFDDEKKVLLLKQTYGDKRWGLPGGSPEAPETIQETLLRECREELGCEPIIEYLSGVYFHREHEAYVFIFKCQLPIGAKILLSSEHSEYKYKKLDSLSPVQKQRVSDCLDFDGEVKSFVF